jgi:photosystem II stability/assembly factor-like uncharacterized protein
MPRLRIGPGQSLLLALVVLLGSPAAPASQTAAPALLTADLIEGLTLRTIGPATMSGRIVDLAVVESDPSTFYAATATGGLWKTVNNGITFTPVFEHERVHSIGAVAVSPNKPDVVWVGTGEAANRQSSSWGDGVYKSTDGGRSWQHAGLRDTKHIGRIALHPTNPDIVFVAALGHLWGPNRERGLFKSVDGGTAWKNVLFVDNDTGVVDVAIEPGDPKVMYAATYQRRRRAWGFHGGGAGSALHKSVDGGDTWTRLEKGLPEGERGRIGIAVYRKDPRIVYACVEQGVRYNAATAYTERRAGIYRSEDRGASWQRMGDWNPRPMYASQIRVDPNDDQRIYMMNSFSYSEDGGKTFTVPRQSLHGDDRVVWIDPRDSRHLIKGDDGGIGISYDRGQTWLYVASLPVSQFYRISVDMQRPFWVYGGLQDNGSWAAPSATYESWGVLNEHWVRTGGGDGFFNVIDTSDNRTLYTSSQYLGLSRLDMVTRERVWIRPGDPKGYITARRNWDTWGRIGAAPEPDLANAMPPANWDAPVLISPHDARTIYVGTRDLWRSSDRGNTWVSLGDRTTGIDRRTLRVMTQLPTENTLSLDDGVPYYPTITAIAESPVRKGVLFVGTDDGNLQVSRDSGRTWLTIANRVPNLPKTSYVAAIEASRHAENTVYVAFDNHRSNDYGNYVYRSTDGGTTWTAIDGDLPSERVVRVVREDPKNPGVLYLGTEMGAYVTADQGAHWIPLKMNMPRVAVNDLVVHPRDNDLVLATHGRGVWILDNLAAIQSLTPAVLGSDAHLFAIEPASMIRYANTKAHAGDLIFRGANPPAGAVIDYFLRTAADKAALTIHDARGRQVASVDAPGRRGVNRAVWSLRYPDLVRRQAREETGEDTGPGTGTIEGPFVLPGTYTVRLTVRGKTVEQPVEVTDDPRLQVSPESRRQWTDTLLQLADLYRSVSVMLESARGLAGKAGADAKDPVAVERRELMRLTGELQSRVGRLYTAISGSLSTPTVDQRAQIEYFSSFANVLESRLRTAATGRQVAER